jgi:hypothetical protein
MSKLEGRWIFLSVLAVVAGALVALAIYVFAIRDGSEAAPAGGPGGLLTQAERDSLGRLHVLTVRAGVAFSPDALAKACDEVTALVERKPFGPFDTSSYPGGSAASSLSAVPGTAHWAAASDLERLRSSGWLLRQAVLRTLTTGDADKLTAAVEACDELLLPAIRAATA